MLEKHVDELLANGIDYEEALDRFAGEGAMYEDFVFRFLSDTKFDELVCALDEEDLEAGHRAAHSLKGLTGSLSFKNYHREVGVLSDACREGNLDAAQSCLSAVENAHSQVINVLQKCQIATD